jgi:zinc protease
MNPCQLVFCFCLLLAGSLAHAGPKIERWQTAAGVQVLLVENHRLPIVDVQVDFAAGAAHESEGRAGVAALTRALLDLGAGGLDETQIASAMADLGAELSGGVDLDRASLRLRTLSMADKVGPAIDLLRTILSRPAFPGAVFERETGAFGGRSQGSADAPRNDCQPGLLGGDVSRPSLWTAGDAGIGEGIAPHRCAGFPCRPLHRASATSLIVGDLSRAQAGSWPSN